MPQRLPTTIAALATLTALSPAATIARAAFVPVHGGPEFTVGVGGYRSPVIAYAPGRSAGSGVGIGTASLIDATGQDRGLRGVRWDALGNANSLESAGGSTSAATSAFAIDAAGTIVGSSQSGSLVEAMRWTPGSVSGTYLGNINATRLGSSAAYAVNAAGTMTGYADLFDDAGQNRGPRAVRWNASGVPTVLDAAEERADGDGAAWSYAVNSGGTVVGFGLTFSSATSERALRWDAGETIPTMLGSLAPGAGGASSAYAVAINDAGTAIGYASKYNAAADGFIGFRAVRWDANEVAAVELGSLGVSINGSSESIANAINEGGTIVGSSDKFDERGESVGPRATRWEADSTDVIELPGLGGITMRSEAFTINIQGDAVGYVDFASLTGTDRVTHAVLWDDAGDAHDLNAFVDPESGWTLSRAVSITDAGWITGIGSFDPDGLGPIGEYDRLFLIQLPEPTTGGAMAAAMLAMTLRRRTPF